MKELDAIASRLRGGTTLAGLLDAGFAAFEVIRLVARVGEDLAPELFAAFLTAFALLAWRLHVVEARRKGLLAREPSS